MLEHNTGFNGHYIYTDTPMQVKVYSLWTIRAVCVRSVCSVKCVWVCLK